MGGRRFVLPFFFPFPWVGWVVLTGLQTKKKKKSKKTAGSAPVAAAPGKEDTTAPAATSTATPKSESGAVKRNLAPRVEEVDE